MTTIRTFFLQFRALFLIFEKGQGRPLKVEKILEYGIKMQKNSKNQKFNLHSHKIFGANKRILLAYGINMQKNSKQLFLWGYSNSKSSLDPHIFVLFHHIFALFNFLGFLMSFVIYNWLVKVNKSVYKGAATWNNN